MKIYFNLNDGTLRSLIKEISMKTVVRVKKNQDGKEKAICFEVPIKFNVLNK